MKSRIILCLIFFLLTFTVNAQRLFELHMYSGLNTTAGGFEKLSENGFNYGAATDVFLSRSFGLGFDVNYQNNNYKPLFDYNRIPPPAAGAPYNLSRLESGSWTAFSFSFGPTYRIGTNSFSVSIYSKAGITKLTGPKARVSFTFFDFQKNLFLLEPIESSAFSVTSGMRIKVGLGQYVSFFVNPQIVYASNPINYSYVDIDKSFIEDFVTGELFFDPGTLFELPLINEKTNPLYYNINAGFTIALGPVKPKKIPSTLVPERPPKVEDNKEEKEEEKEEEKDICKDLSVKVNKRLQDGIPVHRVIVSNNSVPQKGKAEPKSVSIEFKNLPMPELTGEDTKLWERTPKKVSQNTRILEYKFKRGNIPVGEHQLVDLDFGKQRKLDGKLFFTWNDKSGKAICSDTVDIKEGFILWYYDLRTEFSEDFIVHRDSMLNVQFQNVNAYTSVFDFKIIDFEKQEEIQGRPVSAKKTTSHHGLNRLHINLNDYRLSPGNTYLLAVSDMMTHYYLKFKIHATNEK